MKMNSLSWSITLVLLGSSVGVGLQKDSIAEEVQCDLGNCEAAAPYTLKIISRGEGVPQADNQSPEGLQQNRRVDVSISTEVPVKVIDTSAKAAGVTLDGDILTAGGGKFWISRDPTSLQKVLGVNVPTTVTLASDGSLENPVKISLGSNYTAFVERWEMLVLAEGGAIDSEPLYLAEGPLSGMLTDIEWDGSLASGAQVRSGEKYDVALRVYDASGNYDQTASRTIEFQSAKQENTASNTVKSVEDISVKGLSKEVSEYSEGFALQSVAVSGSTVVLRGTELSDVQSVEVNGEKITLVADNKFAAEYILPPGDHEFTVQAKRKSGEEFTRKLDVEVKPGYFFIVGLADLTVGENKVTGSIEPLAVDEHHYGDDIFVDGRLAFYLKGKVKGKYLLTAQMDTGNEDVSELFDNFHRKDASSVFRRIDPDQYYLVYGDDSTIIDDTDSQGKLYLRVDWDRSHALWGNFNTAFSGTELAALNRSLYGAQFRHSSMDITDLGDSKTEISAFISEAQTLFRHNEFSGTGGSLYYLRDQDIVLGSEKVWVEVRRDNSEQVLQKIVLERGRDYEIDEFQGRIILTRPLLSVSTQTGPSIIRDVPDITDNTYLVVDYEYVPADFVNGDATAGLRAQRWINNHVAVGGTWAHEDRDTDDYSVKAFDVTIKKSDNTYVRLEAAQSESNQTSGSFLSTDGGFTFSPFSSNDEAASGGAFGVEGLVSANEIIDLDMPLTVAAWAKRREAGYNTANLDDGIDTTDTGIEVIADVSEVLDVSGRATNLKKESESSESVFAVQADYSYTNKTTVSGEVRHVRNEDLASDAENSATLAAGRVAVQVTDRLETYGIAQGVLESSGGYQDNTLLTAGARAQVSDRLNVRGEVSSGDRGTNLLFGVEHAFSDTYSVYSNLNLLNDQTDSIERLVTLGQRKTVSDKLKIYSEHQFSSEDTRTGLTNTFGLSNTFNRYATGTLSFQSSRIEGELDDVIGRDTLTAGLSFKRQQSYASTKLEFRKDESDTVDTDQWVSVSSIEYRYSPSLRFQGRFNYSSTQDNITGDEARFTEAGLGFSYRPVSNDRLNLLARYTYLFDLPPLSQSGDTDSRSSIFSVEGLYEVGKRWTVGGKLARREGEIRTVRQTGEWIGNDASLAAIRLRYKAPFGVDAMSSYHWLNSDASESLRHGALLSLGHNVGDNLQFSVGYNFTTFDDNLGNDDYDVKGWFFNLVGKY